MSKRLSFDDILGMTPPPPDPEAPWFVVRISPAALAQIMATRWIPENNPEARVKVKGIVVHDDGFADPIIVAESA